MAGLLNQLRTNGLSGHLNQWAEGNAQGITPDDVGQGLGQTILSNIASRTEFLFASQRTNSPPAATHHSGGSTGWQT